jgi:hypothetical protein
MSVRVRSQIILVASLDDDEKQCQFKRDDTTLTSLVETFEVESSGEIELAGAEADYALPMGKVATGKILYLETDKELQVKMDGEAVGHKVGAPTTGTKAKLFLRSEFTSAPLLTNNDATNAAAVSYFIVGQK